MICIDCGTKYTPVNERGAVSPRCCSCRLKRKNEKAAERSKRRRAMNPPKPKMCQRCGKVALPTTRWKYCPDCKKVVDREHKAESGLKMAEKRRLLREQGAETAQELHETKQFMQEVKVRKRFHRLLMKEHQQAEKNFLSLCQQAREAGMSYGKYQAMLRRQGRGVEVATP